MWISEGGVRLYCSGYILTFLLPMFSTPTMLLILNVCTGEGVQLSLCTHILKLLLLVLGVFLKMLLLQNVWTGEGVQLSLYTHILILLLPTILDNLLSTLNKIVPSDKSCLSVKFNSRAPSEVFGLVLMHSYLHCYYQCVSLTRAISELFCLQSYCYGIQNQINHNSCSV